MFCPIPGNVILRSPSLRLSFLRFLIFSLSFSSSLRCSWAWRCFSARLRKTLRVKSLVDGKPPPPVGTLARAFVNDEVSLLLLDAITPLAGDAWLPARALVSLLLVETILPDAAWTPVNWLVSLRVFPVIVPVAVWVPESDEVSLLLELAIAPNEPAPEIPLKLDVSLLVVEATAPESCCAPRRPLESLLLDELMVPEANCCPDSDELSLRFTEAIAPTVDCEPDKVEVSLRLVELRVPVAGWLPDNALLSLRLVETITPVTDCTPESELVSLRLVDAMPPVLPVAAVVFNALTGLSDKGVNPNGMVCP